MQDFEVINFILFEGTIDAYETILPDVLMETEVSQKKSEVCENSYGDDVFFRSKMICANDPGELWGFFWVSKEILNFLKLF